MCSARSYKAGNSSNRGYKFTDPDLNQLDLLHYKVENSPEKKFFLTCCELRTEPPKITDEITTKVMFEVFKEWCKDNTPGFRPKKSDFKANAMEFFRLDEKEIMQRNNKNYYYGFILNDFCIKEYEGRFYSKAGYTEMI